MSRKPQTELEALIAAALREVQRFFDDHYQRALGTAWSGGTATSITAQATEVLTKVRLLTALAGVARMRSFLDVVKQGAQPGEPMFKPTEIAVRGEPKRTPASVVKVFDEARTLPTARAAGYMARELEIDRALAREMHDAFRSWESVAIRAPAEIINDKAQALLREYKAQLAPTDVPTESKFRAFAQERTPKFTQNTAQTTMRADQGVAYGQGLEKQMDAVAQWVGGWKYLSAGDDAVRTVHRLLNGKVFPLHRRGLIPPSGFGCRCAWVVMPAGSATLSDAEVDALEALNEAENPGWLKSPLQIPLGGVG